MSRDKDARSGRVAIVSHCLLNSNSKVHGLARHAGMAMEVLEILHRHDLGLIQLPCPEILYLGPHRWWQSKELYDTPPYRRFCRAQAAPAIEQLLLHAQAGVEVVCVLGVDGSPNCGVSMTPHADSWGGRPQDVDLDGLVVPGRGVFMEELEASMRRKEVTPPPFYGLALEDLQRPLKEILADLEEFIASLPVAA